MQGDDCALRLQASVNCDYGLNGDVTGWFDSREHSMQVASSRQRGVSKRFVPMLSLGTGLHENQVIGGSVGGLEEGRMYAPWLIAHFSLIAA